jgi:hypothetical protein
MKIKWTEALKVADLITEPVATNGGKEHVFIGSADLQGCQKLAKNAEFVWLELY